MSGIFLMTGDEDDLIDAYRPQTDGQSRTITQAPNPETEEMGLHQPEVGNLPDPSVGGRSYVRRVNGYSVGFFPRWQRFRKFDGAMAKLPAVTANPVQGVVGTQNNHTGQLWAGVKNQLADYQASAAQTASTYVGKLNLKETSSATPTIVE